MTITITPRVSLPQWGAGTDPVTRSQFNQAFLNVENAMAIDNQGLLAARGAATIRGRYYRATDAGFYRANGTDWEELPLLSRAGQWTAPQAIKSDNGGNLLKLENATSGVDVYQELHRRTNNADTLWKRLRLGVTSQMSFISGENQGGGVNSLFAFMAGRWAINQPTDAEPADMFVIYNRSGTERFRFTELGRLGIKTSTPIAAVHAIEDNASTGFVWQGNQAAHRFYDAAGTARSIIGLRDDITGNTLDTVYFAYGDVNHRFYTNGVYRMAVQSGGLFVDGSAHFGGVLANSGAYSRITNDGTNSYIETYKIGGGRSDMWLRSSGPGSWVGLQPESNGPAFNVKRSPGGSYGAGSIITATDGWTVSGWPDPVTSIPAWKLRRAVGTISGGALVVAHGGLADGYILFCQAWGRGNSGESIRLDNGNFRVDSTYVYVDVNPALNGRTATVGMIYSATTVW